MISLPLEREAAMVHNDRIPVRPLHDGTIVVHLWTPCNNGLPILVILGKDHKKLVFITSNRLLEHLEEAAFLGEGDSSIFVLCIPLWFRALKAKKNNFRVGTMLKQVATTSKAHRNAKGLGCSCEGARRRWLKTATSKSMKGNLYPNSSKAIWYIEKVPQSLNLW
jgi:hypothetical protein